MKFFATKQKRFATFVALWLLVAQSFAFAHELEHTWASELCDTCVVSQNLEYGAVAGGETPERPSVREQTESDASEALRAANALRTNQPRAPPHLPN